MFQSEVEAFCGMQTSPRTQAEYRKDLTRWFEAGFPLTVDGVVQYKIMLTQTYSDASAARFWSTSRVFHKWLVNRGLLEHSPFETVKAPVRRLNSVIDSPSDNDVDALVASCKSPRDMAVIMLLLCGLRASEVTNLTSSSLRFTPGYGYYLTVVGKGNKERIVPVADDVVDAINQLGNVGSDWLVHNNDGSKLTYDMVNNLVDRASERAGVKIYPHKLRHHYGTRMVRAGVNVLVLSKLLGHANVATTERYVSLDLSDLVEASRLDPMATTGGIRIVPSNLEGRTDAGEGSGRPSALRLASA